MLEAAVSGFQPKQPYELAFAENPDGTGSLQPLQSADYACSPSGYESAMDLWSKKAPEHSIPGIILARVSLIVMPLLSRAKRKVGWALGHLMYNGLLVLNLAAAHDGTPRIALSLRLRAHEARLTIALLLNEMVIHQKPQHLDRPAHTLLLPGAYC